MYIQPWEWTAGGDVLCHIGNKNSGRYRRGSGERPWQHEPGRDHASVAEKKKISKESSSDSTDAPKRKSQSADRLGTGTKAITKASKEEKRQAKEIARAAKKERRKQEKEERAEARKVEKQEKKEAKEALEAEKRQKEAEVKIAEEAKKLAEAINSGDRSEILKNFNKLNNAELRTALERVEYKEKLTGISSEKYRRGKEIADRYLSSFRSVGDALNTAANIKASIDRMFGNSNKKDDSPFTTEAAKKVLEKLKSDSKDAFKFLDEEAYLEPKHINEMANLFTAMANIEKHASGNHGGGGGGKNKKKGGS